MAGKVDPRPPKYTLDNPAGENIKLTPISVTKEKQPPAPVIEEKAEIVIEESANQPVLKEDWIPVIDKTDNQPVLDKGWSPVIKEEKKKVSEQEFLPPPEPDDNKNQITIDKTVDVEKLPYIRLYGSDQKNTKSNFVQDLTSPVISSGELAK
jgi:hypothetical protein